MSSFFKRNKSLIVLAILIFLQLVLISIQIPLGANENYFEKAVFVLFSPVQHGIVSFFQSIGGFLKGYISLRDAHVENEELRREIFSLSQKNRILRNALEHYTNEKEIEALLEKRIKLRKEKKFAEADIIRNQIKEKGYLVEDTSSGVSVEKI